MGKVEVLTNLEILQNWRFNFFKLVEGINPSPFNGFLGPIASTFPVSFFSTENRFSCQFPSFPSNRCFLTSFLFVHSNNSQKAAPSITPTKSRAPSFQYSLFFLPMISIRHVTIVFHSFSYLPLISVSFPYFLLVSMQIRFLSVFFCWDFRLVPVLFVSSRVCPYLVGCTSKL